MIKLTEEEENELKALEADWEKSAKEKEEKRHQVAFSLPGYDVLKRCHLPLTFRARIREMKVGDTFLMGQIRYTYSEEECGFDGYEGVAEMYIQKGLKGLYNLHSTWTLLSKPSRPMTFGHATFKYEKGGVFAFTGENAKENLRSITLISRYIQRLIKNASYDEKEAYIHHNVRPFFCGELVDKNNRTRARYRTNEQGELVRYHIKLTDEQMPKSMMECIIDLGFLSGELKDFANH